MSIIHSCDIPTQYMDGLRSIFPHEQFIPLPYSESVYKSIRSHPDIFLCQLDRDSLVYSKSLPSFFVQSLRERNINLIASDRIPSGVYPDTAILNASRVGKCLFHNFDITDSILKNEAHSRGFEFVYIRQGYARCSMVPLGDKAIITADFGIAEASKKLGIDVQLVSQGGVELPGQQYGFIGGASGVMSDSRVLFLGDIRNHPDYLKIDGFFKNNGCEYIYIPGLPLFDAGSLVAI